jgi:hypothetical protein
MLMSFPGSDDAFVTKIVDATSVADTPGVYAGTTGAWFLRNATSSGGADLIFTYGPTGNGIVPLTGDWDGDGDDSPGLYVSATGAWFLRNTPTSGPANLTFVYGPPGVTPIAGDWDGQ